MASSAPIRAQMLYQDSATVRSLVRNGEIVTHRDGTGSDSDVHGLRLTHVEVEVHDARELSEPASLDRHGFTLAASGTSLHHSDFYNETEILQRYYEECKELVKRATGAKLVEAFDHNVRTAHGRDSNQSVGERDGRNIQGGNAVQGAAYVVHADYTLTSAPDRLEQLGEPPRVNDTLHKVLGDKALLSQEAVDLGKRGHFMLVNVWRPIADTPVEVVPLGMCDSTTVTAEDMCVAEIHYADRIGENYLAAHSERHRWYYYPQMHRDEALLLKTWDSSRSAADGSAFSLHSAFQDPTARPSAPPRESIEVRTIAIFDEPAVCKL